MTTLAFRRKYTPVDLPESWLAAQKDFGFSAIGFPIGFKLYRCKRGAEVWLHFQSGFRLNLSVDRDVWPANFFEARRWAVAFADAHGFTAREIKRKAVAKQRERV